MLNIAIRVKWNFNDLKKKKMSITKNKGLAFY